MRIIMRTALLSLHVSILLASWTGILGRYIDLSPVMLVWWRVAIAGSVLPLVCLFLRKLEKTTPGQFAKYAFLGAVLAWQWVLFYAAIKASNVSVAIAAFSAMGVFTALFEPFFSRTRLSLKEILYSLLTVFGIALIFQFDVRYRLGVFFGVASAAMAAVVTIFMKRFGREHNPPTVLSAQMAGALLSLSAGLLLIYAGVFDAWHVDVPHFYPLTLRDAVALVIFATVITLGMYLLQFVALKHVSAFTVNLSYNMEPVYSIVLAMVIFDEARELSGGFWAGLALIGLSVLLQTLDVMRGGRRRPSAGT